MKKVHRGWRYFDCSECGAHWRETCRDHETESRSKCVTADCKANLYGGVTPYGSDEDASIQVDDWGNLVGETKVERL